MNIMQQNFSDKEKQPDDGNEPKQTAASRNLQSDVAKCREKDLHQTTVQLPITVASVVVMVTSNFMIEDGQHGSTSSHCARKKPKYPVQGRFHFLLAMSSEAKVCH